MDDLNISSSVQFRQIVTFRPKAGGGPGTRPGPEFELNHEALGSIFEESRDKNVAVISVCGAARQGRSFLLNFILRYLTSLEAGEEDDMLGWDRPTDPLIGSAWGSGDERRTTGIWVTNRPILVPAPASGGVRDVVAVYLVDTQGVLDEFSSAAQSSKILSLCLRLSTTLVFSSAFELHEDKLLGLADAIAAAAEARSPCSHIYVVVRDWSQTDRFPHGQDGGRLYKERRLQIQEHHSDASRDARQTIDANVGLLECFLLPSPGPSATTSKQHDFNGSLTSLSTKFTTALESFLLSIQCRGSGAAARRTGADCIALFEASFGFEQPAARARLNNNDLSAPIPRRRATATVTTETRLKTLTQTLVDDYTAQLQSRALETPPNKFLTPASFDALHSELRGTALEKYARSNLQADDASVSRLYQQTLEAQLEQVHVRFRKLNDEARAACLGKWENAVSRAIEIYRREVRSMFSNVEPGQQRAMNAQLVLRTRNKFMLMVEAGAGADGHEKDLYAIYSQNLSEAFGETYAEEQAAAAERGKGGWGRNLRRGKDATATVPFQRVPAHMEVMEDLLQGRAAAATATAASAHEDEDEGSGDDLASSYQVSARRRSLVRVEKTVHSLIPTASERSGARAKESQAQAKENQLKEKRQEWLQPALKAYKSYLKDWRQELGNGAAGATTTKYEHAASEAKQQAKAVLKEKTMQLADDEDDDGDSLAAVVTTLFTELNDAIDELHREELKKLTQQQEGRQQKMETLTAKYRDLMNRRLQSSQLPTPEALDDFHAETVKEILAETEGGEDGPEIRSNLRQKLAGEPYADFQRKAAAQLKARKRETKESLRKASERYQQRLHSVGLQEWATTSDLAKYHRQILARAIQDFNESVDISDVAFLASYVDQLEAEANIAYEKQLGLLEMQLERQKLQIEGQVGAASKAFEERMRKHFETKPFLPQRQFRLAIERIMMHVVSEFGSMLTETGRRTLLEDLESRCSQFVDQNTMNTPTKDMAIGIDLGTTYSCVAVYHNGQVQIVPSGLSGTTVPSYVGYVEGTELVGKSAKNQAHENPVDTIFDAKRLIGRDFKDPVVQADMKLWPFKVVEKPGTGKPSVVCRGHPTDPEVISAKVLKHLRTMAQNYLNVKSIEKVVITVPAYFTDGQRQATRDAGEIAGLDVLRIINEPTAAAMAYFLHHRGASNKKEKILVYDLGGGTFDVSILEIRQDNLEVLGVGGDTHLGGEDFDGAMVEFCIEQFKAKTGVDLAQRRCSPSKVEQVAAARHLRRLRNECEERKRDLSEADQTTIVVDEIYGHDLNVKMTRTDFEFINRAKFEQTIEIVEKTLKDAKPEKLKADDIHEIVLVGGSTRIPRIRKLLSDFFSGRPLNQTLNADEAVARGAAILAAKLNGAAEQSLIDMKFKDVNPLSVGIELVDGSMSVVVAKNEKVPCKLTRKGYATVNDNQTTVSIRIFEGEDPVAKKNHFLGSFELLDVPPGPKGKETLEVTVEMNGEGILHCTAKLDSTGGSNDIMINVKEEKGRLLRGDIILLRDKLAAK